jgi:hypothetical protein
MYVLHNMRCQQLCFNVSSISSHIICRQIPYTNAVDVHSFGMVLYEMAHRGRRPYWQVALIEHLHIFLL